ncbi:TIGR02281 family clan AA aspartic protease [uncultured Parasphingorhabdus sp.]|uniref:retropepsin-like aspartic protease family protein n=1 Tax=uncultured Parasphingorhabdus sp. TaxID=2709694 RepID=UPI0030D89AD4|tara:strand:- start:72080 stop:72604 length:525 start_codon:yes stop_codon:yes gene_type:complete
MTASIVLLFGAIQIGDALDTDNARVSDTAYLASSKNIARGTFNLSPSGISIERAQDGLFHVTALVNGQPVDMAIDTGATRTVITQNDATRIGLSSPTGTYSNMETLNGQVRLSRMRIDKLTVGNREIEGLEVVLGPQALKQSVIGLDAISRSSPLLVDGDRLTLLTTKSRAASE